VLRLVKSVKGIGNRTTSFLEQFIVDVVGIIVPSLEQGRFGKFQPRGAFGVALNRDAHMRLIRQGERFWQNNFAALVNGVHGRRHGEKLNLNRWLGKQQFGHGSFALAQASDDVIGRSFLHFPFVYFVYFVVRQI
jgi:hypothetical protein